LAGIFLISGFFRVTASRLISGFHPMQGRSNSEADSHGARRGPLWKFTKPLWYFPWVFVWRHEKPMGFSHGNTMGLTDGLQARMHRRTVSNHKSMFIVFALALCVDCHGIKWHWDLYIQCPILTSANQTRLAGKTTIYFRDSSGILQPPLMTPEGTPSHEIMTNPSLTVLRCIKPVLTRG
jgi:hypothetical protein